MSIIEPAVVSENTLAPPPRENLFRALAEAPELERADGDTMPTLTGHFAVFDQWTPIRSMHENRGRPFLERFAPGAFNKTIAESGGNVKVLFNHGRDPQIGDKVLGTIQRLEEDSTGAFYEVPLFDTSYNRDLIPGLDAGVYGASFRFSVLQQTYDEKPKRSDHNPEGIPERTVTEARLAEFGPVTFPAYAGATSGLRSITDEILLGRLMDDPEYLRELLAAVQQRRTVLEPEPSEAATPPEPGIEPEPSEATTRQTQTPATPVRLYPYREEKPRWLL